MIMIVIIVVIVINHEQLTINHSSLIFNPSSVSLIINISVIHDHGYPSKKNMDHPGPITPPAQRSAFINPWPSFASARSRVAHAWADLHKELVKKYVI